jgi:hypothetical protein
MSNKLEQAAIDARAKLLPKNAYNGADDANKYTSKHTRAMSDQTTPIYGKGTGVFLDTYNGGGDLDVNGNPFIPGSGRVKAIANNVSTWGYGPGQNYTQPDTSGNVGQVKFG